MGGNIAHISHNRWWCTFFRARENLAQRTGPILAITSGIFVPFGVLFTGLNNVAMYQNGQI